MMMLHQIENIHKKIVIKKNQMEFLESKRTIIEGLNNRCELTEKKTQ